MIGSQPFRQFTFPRNRALVGCIHGALVRFLVLGLSFLLAPATMRAQVSFFAPPTYDCSSTQFEADFNRDGKPDLLCNSMANKGFQVLLGTGDGTFSKGIPVGGTPLAVADFNGDGIPDVLEQGTGTLQVLLGKGDGTFQPAVSTPSAASLTAVAAGDLNGDGKADVVGVFNSSLIVYLGKGDGTFANGVSYPLPTGAFVVLLILGDVNGDGKTDVIALSSNGGVNGSVILVYLGNGDGTLQSPKTSVGVTDPFPAGAPAGVAVEGDFNGDGKPDLAINGSAASIWLLLGKGDGTFQTPTSVISASGPITAADLNKDGKLDLVVEDSSVSAQVYLGNGDGTFSKSGCYVLSLPYFAGFATTGDQTSVTITDFNLDGKLDVAMGGAMLLGNGDGTLQGVEYLPLPTIAPAIAVVGSFDKGTSAPGVAVWASNALYILSNNGKGQLTLANSYTLQEPAGAIVTADFNGDGSLDLVLVGQDPTTQYWSYTVLLGNGDGSFQPPVSYPQTSGNANSVLVADFNNDHKPDLAVTFASGSGTNSLSLAILLGNGDGTFAAPAYVYDDGAPFLSVADFNRDGKLDIAGTTSTGTMILYGKGDGTFQPAVLPPSLNGFSAYLTADLNGDGIPDLLGGNDVALGKGDGTFTVLPPFSTCRNSTDTCLGAGAVADFTGNGRLDLLGIASVYQGPAVQSGVLLGNGDGTFGSFINLPPKGILPSPLVADMNNDGRPDLVFTWGTLTLPTPTAGVGVLFNTTAAGFALSASALSPATVTAGNSATSTLTVASTFGFKGAVTLTCSITPVMTPAPTCTFSNSSVQLTGSGAQSVKVTVGTSAPVTTSAVPHTEFLVGAAPLIWTMMFLVSGCLLLRNRKRLPALAMSLMALAIATWVGCGGGGGASSHQTTPGTPAGTYTAAITASAGTLNQTMKLTIVVQ